MAVIYYAVFVLGSLVSGSPVRSRRHCSVPWSCSSSECPTNNHAYVYDEGFGGVATLSTEVNSQEVGINNSLRVHVLNLAWTVEALDDDMPVIGFVMQYNRYMPSKGINVTNSTTFLLKPGETVTVGTTYNYSCLKLSIASTYTIKLFSIHQLLNASKRVVRSIGSTVLNTSCDLYDNRTELLKRYIGFMNIEQDQNNGIVMYFTPASSAYGFTGYTVQLVSSSLGCLPEIKNLRFTCVNHGAVRFYGNPPGRYWLKVIPTGGVCAACRGYGVRSDCHGFHVEFNITETETETVEK